MTPKTFIALGVVAVVSVAAAVVAVGTRPQVAEFKATGEPIFPKIAQQINDVEVLKIEQAAQTLTFRKQDGTWVLDETGGYPARADEIAKALVALSELTLLEPKTKLQGRYPKLEVEDPERKDAKSQRVTVVGKDGEELGKIILGKANHSLPQTAASGGVYVRLPGDKQAWLAAGDADFDDEIRDWVVRDIVDIDKKRISKVTVTHPDGQTVAVSKESEDASEYRLADVPEGRKAEQTALDSLVAIVEGLQLNDVKPRAQVDVSQAPSVSAVYETFDGLELHAEVYLTADDKSWLLLDAAAPAADDDGERTKEAQKIVGRVNPWIYEIPDWHGDQLRKKVEDLTEEVEKPKS